MDFVPIRISTLRGDLKIPFDVYIQVAGKQILYCRQGDSFEGERLNRLKSKKLKEMYILAEAESAYRQYLSRNIEMAYDESAGKSTTIRAQIIQGVQQAATEDLMQDPESAELYEVAKQGTKRFIDFIFKNDEAFKAVIDIPNNDKNVAHHGVTVATYVVEIAKTLGVHEQKPFQLVALTLGCQLHDIEHQYSGLQFARPLQQMEEQDLALYKNHPSQGYERLKGKHWDSLTLDVILNHEETIDGSGFPRGLTEKELDPLLMIASSANAYDRFITFEGLDHKVALKHMLVERIGCYPVDYLKALQDVLKTRGLIG